MNIEKILAEMTTEEKAALCSGLDFWHTKPNERLDIPSVMVSDGPHGLRKNVDYSENPNQAITAVCFPTACASACSFDRKLLEELGKAIGEECQNQELAVILGPGCNIKRSPLCGRNFEYFSEDPYLAGQLAAAHIKGVQSKGVGTSLKHFACNNQESRRFTVSAEVSERALREIYLTGFETAVKEAKPWTIMCSYNKINGVHSSQNKWLLTDLLRGEWGYEGLVMSDWGAVDDRIEGVKAGLDLEMPGSNGKNDKRVVDAVEKGLLDEKDLDICTRRVLELVDKSCENARPDTAWDIEAHHKLAARLASECIVLLKNENKLLPLDAEKKIAFIGEFAKTPRFQGGGSSHINSYKIDNALEASAGFAKVTFAAGYIVEDDKTDEALLDEAVKAAQDADIAVIFAGLPDSFESEGYDRTHMRLPYCQLELIDKVCEVNKNVVIVLHNGSPVEMPFADKVSSIVEAYLCGEGTGTAVCDVLFGKVNPSGKLAETMPVKLEDNPAYLNFPGEGDTVRYAEDLFVGYRYYDKKKTAVRFPFGHGLSYTEFEYSDIKLSGSDISENDTLSVSVTVTNKGDVKGKEVVQLYVSDRESSVIRPVKELKGFEKVELKPGESKKVVFRLDKRSFAYFEPSIGDWYVEYGAFDILVGSSSADIRLTSTVYVSPASELPVHFTINSHFGDLRKYPECGKILDDVLKDTFFGVGFDGDDENMRRVNEAITNEFPLRAIVSFSDSPLLTRELMQSIVDKCNAAVSSEEI
ncbi:MAG: glycoside hydrolase family 3 C-terminal domain-containing protein [Ruminococcus sp.]|nr:glycoside hydrolase family 3 C-terminal domain-containing protein [Ruminococcus sp.]